jgi:hypothetical protein
MHLAGRLVALSCLPAHGFTPIKLKAMCVAWCADVSWVVCRILDMPKKSSRTASRADNNCSGAPNCNISLAAAPPSAANAPARQVHGLR